MAVLLGGLLYLGTTFVLLKPSSFAGALANRETKTLAPGDDPSWKFLNPEFDQLVDELRREKDALALRSQQLQELQTRLEAERQEMQSATQMVHQLQIEFDQSFLKCKAQEVDNLKKQIKVIAGMSPEGVAAMMGEMTDDEVAKLLTLMKTDEAGAILDAMSTSGSAGAKRAVSLTDKMRRVMPVAPGAKPTAAP